MRRVAFIGSVAAAGVMFSVSQLPAADTPASAVGIAVGGHYSIPGRAPGSRIGWSQDMGIARSLRRPVPPPGRRSQLR